MSIPTRNYIYGLSPLKRENPARWQSEWYYFDPRNASTFSDFKQIDVPSQNTPNPYAKEIQNYIFKTDSDNYKLLYGNAQPPQENQQNQPQQENVMGTAKNVNNNFFQPQSTLGQAISNNVAQQPAAEEQSIAEAINSSMPKSVDDVPDMNYIMKIRKLLGDDIRNTQDAFELKPYFDESKSFTTDEGGIVYDVKPTIVHSNDLLQQGVNQEDLNLFDRTVEHLKEAEWSLKHAYLDTTWHRTVGVGANVDDWQQFKKVNWLVNGRPATENEKRIAYNKFTPDIEEGKKHLDANNDIIKNNKKASYYENYSNLRINEAEMKRLFRSHIEEDLKYLRKEFPDFDTFPENLKDILLDIKFSTGNVSCGKWEKLRRGIDNKNLKEILGNVHRKDVSNDRNVWVEQKIKDIEKW